MIYRGKTIEGQPAANWKAIQATCTEYPEFIIEVRKFDEQREISLQQMAYIHAVVIPALADHVGCSRLMAEILLKKKCGEEWFIQKVDGIDMILSKTMLTTKQTTQWLENCWDWMESIGCPVPPPDPKWREQEKQ